MVAPRQEALECFPQIRNGATYCEKGSQLNGRGNGFTLTMTAGKCRYLGTLFQTAYSIHLTDEVAFLILKTKLCLRTLISVKVIMEHD